MSNTFYGLLTCTEIIKVIKFFTVSIQLINEICRNGQRRKIIITYATKHVFAYHGAKKRIIQYQLRHRAINQNNFHFLNSQYLLSVPEVIKKCLNYLTV